MVHELKCSHEFWPEIRSGRKMFEFRKNDRNFAVGDVLVLKLWDKRGHFEAGEDPVARKVTYVMRDWEFAPLKNGYCVLSLDKV